MNRTDLIPTLLHVGICICRFLNYKFEFPTFKTIKNERIANASLKM